MKERTRIFALVLIMLVVAFGATGVALYSLYRAAFRENRERLRETVQSRARMIEAIARFDAKQAGRGQEKAAFRATISQIKEAHQQFKGFGETGEFTLARRQGEQIVFLLSHRHRELGELKPVAFSSRFAEPMRRALLGKSGTVVGLDYRGETVLAAYEPVDVQGLGIVAKIDLAEVRRPFILAGVLAGGFTIVLVLLGSVLFLRIGNPLIRTLEENARQLRNRIVEQARTQKALAESRSRFMNIFSSNMLGMLFWDAEGNISDANDAFLEMVGHSRDELDAGEVNWKEMTPAEFLDADERKLGELAETGVIEPFEKEYFHKDGHRVPIILGAATDPGLPNEGVCFVVDRTVHQRAEEATRQSLREKEVLLREIHHRVKNNLQVISSMLNLQRRTLKDPTVVDALMESRNRVNTMALVHEKLYQSADVRTIQLGDYIKSVASNVYRGYGISHDAVSLQVDLGEVELDVNKANPCGMIINELISNALKHGFPQGRKGTIRVSLHDRDDHLELMVQDDGVGLPSDAGSTDAGGLGMKLVEAFVDQLKGTIKIESGDGVKVTVSFQRNQEPTDD